MECFDGAHLEHTELAGRLFSVNRNFVRTVFARYSYILLVLAIHCVKLKISSGACELEVGAPYRHPTATTLGSNSKTVPEMLHTSRLGYNIMSNNT